MAPKHSAGKAKTHPDRSRRFAKPKAVGLFLLFATVGSLILLSVHASSSTASLEPENGTVKSPASVCSGSGLSNGGCVQFGAAVTPPTAAAVGLNAYHSSDFTQIAGLGIKDIRMDFPGGTDYSNPSSANYSAAKSKGLTILPIFDYNYWSNTGGCSDGHCGVAPGAQLAGSTTEWSNAKLWADQYIATIQGPISSTGSPAPQAIEVYNEPWNPGFWSTPNANDYLKLVMTTATEVWKVWPNTKILVSADTLNQTTDCGATWRDKLLAADTTGFLNDARIHPTDHTYTSGRAPDFVWTSSVNDCGTTFTAAQYNSRWAFNRYENVYQDFKAHGHPNPTVWVTEYGWSTASVSQAVQASDTVAAVTQMTNSGHVEKSFAWLLNSQDSADGENWVNGTACKQVCSAVQSYISSH